MTERDDAEKFLAYINIIFNIIVVNLSLNYMQSVWRKHKQKNRKTGQAE